MSEIRIRSISSIDSEYSIKVEDITKDTTSTVSDLRELDTPNPRAYYNKSRSGNASLGEGQFVFREGDFSAQVSNDPQQGVYIPPAASPSGDQGAWVRAGGGKEGAKPEWFGAIGDGVNDDAPAINAALALNKRVIMSPGQIYRLLSPVIVNEGCSLIGPGSANHIGVQWDSEEGAFTVHPELAVIAVDFGAGGSGMTDAAIQMRTHSTVSGLSFFYPSQEMFTENYTPDTYPAAIALEQTVYEGDPTYSIEGILVENCHFCNPWQAINFSSRHSLGIIRHCTGYAWDNMIFIDESYDVERIIECQFNTTLAYVGNYSPDNMYGYQGSLSDSASIRIGKADACRIIGTFVYGFNKGLHIDKFGSGYPNGVYVFGGGWEGCVSPLWAIKPQGLYVHGVMFGADTIGTDESKPYSTMPLAKHAITLSGDSGDPGRSVVFNACTVWTARWCALDANYIEGITVNGCTFSDSNKVDRGFPTAVMMTNNCNQVSVQNSFLDQNTGQDRGGQYFNAGHTDGIMFQNNQHRGCTYKDGWYIGNCSGGFVGTLLEDYEGGPTRIITTYESNDIEVGNVIAW